MDLSGGWGAGRIVERSDACGRRGCPGWQRTGASEASAGRAVDVSERSERWGCLSCLSIL